MRSMVEREAQAHAVRARHHLPTDLAKPSDAGASLSTTLRVVPLSQVGEV